MNETASGPGQEFLPVEVLAYSDVVRKLGSTRAHILVGNGFSIACDPVFRYTSLYEAAVRAGLSTRAQSVFERLGTNNFESVLRLLEDAQWVGVRYGIGEAELAPLLEDAEIVKQTLVEAVTNSHLDHTGCVPDEKKTAAKEFLKRYHSVFTTNYDLLLYWTVLHGGPASHEDGFRADDDDPEAPYLVFSERLGDKSGLYYLHGALHLYIEGGQLRKHSWIRRGQRLTESIRTGLAERQYPLFVAEGSPDKKLQQIQRVGYLWYALDKFARIHNPLVVLGHALGPSDQHIADAIADNKDIRQLFIGLHGDPESSGNLSLRSAVQRIQRRREERKGRGRKAAGLAIEYFDTASARPWGS
jgi:hypothetical protein